MPAATASKALAVGLSVFGATLAALRSSRAGRRRRLRLRGEDSADEEEWARQGPGWGRGLGAKAQARGVRWAEQLQREDGGELVAAAMAAPSAAGVLQGAAAGKQGEAGAQAATKGAAGAQPAAGLSPGGGGTGPIPISTSSAAAGAATAQPATAASGGGLGAGEGTAWSAQVELLDALQVRSC